VLNAINSEDSYESGFDERRVIIWTLDFTMKTHLFGPVDNGGLINKIMVNLYPTVNVAASANTNEQVYITPGQFANGLATNNYALSIETNLISANSDYGISSKIFNVGQNANTHKYWSFLDSPHISTVSFGPALGNTSYDGWETLEPGNFTANGEVSLSLLNGNLRHTILKTCDDDGDYQENLYLQIYANTNPDWVFEPFYGKKYQKVEIKYKTEQTNGSAATFSFQGKLRWITTNTGETEWSVGAISGQDRYLEASIPSGYGGVSDYDFLTTDYQTLSFDLSSMSDWNDRVITGLQFDLFAAVDNDGPMTIQTDIDYIKIAVKE